MIDVIVEVETGERVSGEFTFANGEGLTGVWVLRGEKQLYELVRYDAAKPSLKPWVTSEIGRRLEGSQDLNCHRD